MLPALLEETVQAQKSLEGHRSQQISVWMYDMWQQQGFGIPIGIRYYALQFFLVDKLSKEMRCN